MVVVKTCFETKFEKMVLTENQNDMKCDFR
jgi:hypothetical protein